MCGSPSRGRPPMRCARFIEQNVPMIMLADVGNVSGETRDRLIAWVEDGGMLVRFAGPRLAGSDDDLVPVKLRRGGRTLGGSLSWDQPQPLAAFSKEGPFGNMPVPKDVNVTRQVLAEPEAGLADRTWATLADGTPLVTATKRGKGMIVLFHVTADTRWSDLPLSGSFVEMLRRMVGMAGTTTANDEMAKRTEREVVPPTRILDGFGAFGPPTATTRPVPVGLRRARHRRSSARVSMARRKDCSRSTRLRPPTGWSGSISPAPRAARGLSIGEPLDLRGPVLMAALVLLALDALVVFLLAGGSARFCASARSGRSGAGARRRGRRADVGTFGSQAFAQDSTQQQRRKPAGSAPPATSAAARAGRSRLRHEGDGRDTARLRRHRRRRGRRHQQIRPAGPHAVPRPAHRARSRRAGRPRHRPRRAFVLPADLLAGRAGRGRSLRPRRWRASTPI